MIVSVLDWVSQSFQNVAWIGAGATFCMPCKPVLCETQAETNLLRTGKEDLNNIRHPNRIQPTVYMLIVCPGVCGSFSIVTEIIHGD